jgi:predicted DNA-binding ribbon-helix-helix protein
MTPAYECRHIQIEGYRTSIALEPLFWQQAEAIAQTKGIKWQQWVSDTLENNLNGSRASRLRLAILSCLIQ